MKWAAEFCQFEKKIEHSSTNGLTPIYEERMLYSLFVETRCTSKLLQGEMCRSSIDKMTRPIMKNMSVVAMAFNLPVSCVYSCRNVLEVHRYFPVHVEQMLHLFCKLFLSKRRTASLVIGAFLNNDAIWRLW